MPKKVKKKKTAPPLTAAGPDELAFQRLLHPDYYGLTKTKIAEHLGIHKQGITRWTKVPLKHVRVLSEKTGIPRDKLLPSEF